jgi:hypothetical protein
VNLFGAVGGMVSSFRVRDAWSSLPELREKLSKLELQPVDLAPGATWEGILLFLPQEGPMPAGRATLGLWLKDAEGRQLRTTLVLALPVPAEPVPASPAPAGDPAS